MTRQEFEKAVAECMGIKDGDVKLVEVRRTIDDGVYVNISMKPSTKQYAKLKKILLEAL